jgi:4-alpha-glucanotransferase
MRVAGSYTDQAGRVRTVPEETVRRVEAAMGEPYDGPSPLVVTREGSAEAGGCPVGEYDLPGGRALLVAPRRCPLPPRTWGWAVQLYAVRSAASWGIGDLADLARLARWSGADEGAGFLLVNPLNAVAPGLPQEPSPYFPASRRFANPLYLAVEDLPEVGLLAPAERDEVLALGTSARTLNDSPLIDRDAVWRAKSSALETLFTATPRAAVEAYLETEGEALDTFALWCALAERHGPSYQEWPSSLRHPANPAVRAARGELRERIAYHAWLQWRCVEQLAEAQRCARESGMAVGVVHDLPVGCDPGGADAWAQQDAIAPGMTIGAPPDAFNPDGQDWRLPPWRPDALRRSGYAPYRDLVRALLRDGGGIRVDHAMGLWRLFWVPEGCSPADGTYVSYDADALLGILAYECHAAGAVAVAEDLGTVEPGVPEALRDSGVLSSAVLWFEEGAPESYPEQAFASVTTHDLPTARGFWSRPGNEDDRARVLSLLRAAGLIGAEPSEDDLVVAMHAFVARSPALLAAVALGDAVGDPRQPNVPGDDTAPNWRIPLDVKLDDLPAHPLLRRVVEAVRQAR